LAHGGIMKKEVDFQSPKTLGLQLVTMLVYKLRGQITVDQQNGAHVTITFTNTKMKDETWCVVRGACCVVRKT
jgi:two-component sensor histidine kinase